ncbi:unnamed protein product [Acanthosepion pharaonis]|uniref:Uncharacterized protein n=1 Tax=Acanthosepion pharaonis TaxID=158019 RepID=A0A812D6L1_ACAPH|nr:unnamed protein product [Sepia pharaonis]
MYSFFHCIFFLINFSTVKFILSINFFVFFVQIQSIFPIFVLIYSFFHCIFFLINFFHCQIPTFFFFVFFHPKQIHLSYFGVFCIFLPLSSLYSFIQNINKFPSFHLSFLVFNVFFLCNVKFFFYFSSFVFFHPKSNPSFFLGVLMFLSSTVFSNKLFPLSNSYFLALLSLLCILSSKIKSIFPICVFNVFFLPLYFHFLINFFHCQIPTFLLSSSLFFFHPKSNPSFLFFQVFNVFFLPKLSSFILSSNSNHLSYLDTFKPILSSTFIPYKIFHCLPTFYLALLCILSSKVPSFLFFLFNVFTSFLKLFQTVFNVFFLPLYFHFLINFLPLSNSYFLLSSSLYSFIQSQIHLFYLGVSFILSSTVFNVFFLPLYFHFLINFSTVKFILSSSLYSFIQSQIHLSYFCLMYSFFQISLPYKIFFPFYKALLCILSSIFPIFHLFFLPLYFHFLINFSTVFNVFFLPLYFHFLINFFHCQIPFYLAFFVFFHPKLFLLVFNSFIQNFFKFIFFLFFILFQTNPSSFLPMYFSSSFLINFFLSLST